MPNQRADHIDIGAGIKHARITAGMTQAQIAKHLHVTQAAISHYESNYRPIRTGMLLDIARHTGVSICDILDAANAANEKALAR